LLLSNPKWISASKGGGSTKVLIVDDNLLLASLLQIMLEDEGYETRCAGDGQEGYAGYLFFRPDVVITDLHMPRANGLELMQRIRRLNPGVKAIYMSGDLSPFSALLQEEASRYSANILSKPFSKEDLLNLLAEPATGGKEGLPLASPEPRRMAE
jgi:CheY-like chemotaxis protein